MLTARSTSTAVSTRPKYFPWTNPCAYDDGQKAAFHREAAKRLRQLAKIMALDKADYAIRSNKAGPAVSGEITLHHERIYIQISQFGHADGILYRSCRGRADFAGGANNFAALPLLDDLPSLARRIAPLLNTTIAESP
ncbi:hypothetical protein [Hyphomicrobium sp. MC8b]|uniref:hypothetical protein n=1 Tax=Hyphomicrobium sp. MC8b TaxID=300273 RepID=UPI00391DE785